MIIIKRIYTLLINRVQTQKIDSDTDFPFHCFLCHEFSLSLIDRRYMLESSQFSGLTWISHSDCPWQEMWAVNCKTCDVSSFVSHIDYIRGFKSACEQQFRQIDALIDF